MGINTTIKTICIFLDSNQIYILTLKLTKHGKTKQHSKTKPKKYN